MEQSPSWEANWFAGSQEIPRILWNPKVHYRTHKRPPPVLQVFLNMNVLQGGVVSTSPNPQAGGPPLVGCPRLLIKFIGSYPPYWRPFLYPQPEDAPCRGDRDPLHMVTICTAMINSWKMRYVGHVTCMAGEGKYIHTFTLACFIIFTFFTKFLLIM